MQVTVKLFATLREYAKEGDRGICVLDLPEETRIQEIVDMLKIPEGIPKILLINGVQKKLEDVIQEGDTLSIFPPIAGG